MIDAYVDGRPMPFSSSSLMSVACEKRGGGCVKCWSGVTLRSFRRSPRRARQLLLVASVDASSRPSV